MRLPHPLPLLLLIAGVAFGHAFVVHLCLIVLALWFLAEMVSPTEPEPLKPIEGHFVGDVEPESGPPRQRGDCL